MAQQRKDFETAIMKLRKDMETVVARLQEQAGKNSRMSDRVEMSNTAPQIVRLINKPATALWAVQSRAHQRTRQARGYSKRLSMDILAARL